MKKVILIVLLVLVGLWATNPGMEEFSVFVKERAERRISEATGGGTLGRVLGGAGGSLVEANTDRVTKRTSYLVASTYAMDPDGDGVAEYEFLGVGTTFFVLQEPER